MKRKCASGYLPHPLQPQSSILENIPDGNIGARKVLWRHLLLAAACGAAVVAPAQDTNETKTVAELKKLSPEQLMGIEVQTVTTASKYEEKVTEAPATVIVITANDIKLRGYAMLTDVLRDLPGMETIPFYFSEIGTQVPVRGIQGNNKIIVLVNGMRVNPPGGEAFPFRSDFSVRNAERIEVIYGPGSTLYGQDAISLVINVITKKPTTDGGEVGLAAGNNATRDAWGSFGGALDKNGHVRLSGYAQYHDSDLTRLDKAYPQWWAPYNAPAEQRNEGAVPYRQDYGLNMFARLEIEDTSLQIWNRDSRRSSNEGAYPAGAYVPEAIWEDQSTVIEGRNTLHLSDAVKLVSAVTYNRYEINPDTRYVFSQPGLTNAWFLNDFKYGVGQSYTIEETLNFEINDRLKFLGGIELGNFDIIPKSTVPGGANPSDVIQQGGYFAYTTGTDPTLHLIPRVVDVKYDTYAAYGEFNYAITDRLKLIAGTRVTEDTRFDSIPFTPRGSLIYKITDQLTAKYIFTRAYVAPSPYSGNATYDNGQLLATSNPNLSPETSEAHEVNLSFDRTNLSVGVSLYYGEQHNLIKTSDSGLPSNIIATNVFLNGDPSQPRTLVETVNGGDSRNYGMDFYGRATISQFSAWFSYSYVNFQEKEGNMTYDLTGASTHNGRLGVTWAITDKFYVTPSLVIRSTPNNVPPDSLVDELKVPYEIDLYALYQLTEHIDIYTQLNNITNHHYALGGFGFDGQAIPEETFNGTIGLRATF